MCCCDQNDACLSRVRPRTTVTFPTKLSIPFSFSTQPLDSSQPILPTRCPTLPTACLSILISNRGRSNNDGEERALSSYNDKPSAPPTPTCLCQGSIFEISVPHVWPDPTILSRCTALQGRHRLCVPYFSHKFLLFFFSKKRCTSSSCLELHPSSCYTSASLTRKEWDVLPSGTGRVFTSLFLICLLFCSLRAAAKGA